VNLGCRSEMCCTRLAGNAGPKKSQSAHHRTTLSGYIFITKACIDNQKKNLLNSNTSPTCNYNMVNCGALVAEIFVTLGHPNKLQQISRLGFVTAATSLTGGQPNVYGVWPPPVLGWNVTYTFSRALAPYGNFASCKIHFASNSCALLYWQCYCTALEQWASAKYCSMVQGMELLNFHRRRHLYSARWPSGWALAHSLFALLWPPDVIGQAIIFCHGFFLLPLVFPCLALRVSVH